MRLSVNFVAALVTAGTFAAVATVPAWAECKRYGFSVNDYGKDGPTKDAKSLLDKMIATKMSEKGIKDYKTGKKSVRCELFLDFVVFDEYTCTAEATTCWGGSSLPSSERADAADEEAGDKEKAAAAEPAKDKKKEAAAEKKEAAVEKMSSAAEKAVKATKPETASAKKAEEKKEASSTAVSTSKAEAAKDRIAKEVAEKAIPDPKDAHPVSDTAKAEDPAIEAAETKEAKHEDAAPAGASSGTSTDTANASSSDKAATASSDKSEMSATAAAAKPEKKQEAAAKKATGSSPVETGSLAEPAKKPVAKHSTEKSAKSASRSVRHLAPEAGYPVPMPPPDDLAP